MAPKSGQSLARTAGTKQGFAVLRAENIMDPNRAKGIGHRETFRIRQITTCKYVFIILRFHPGPPGILACIGIPATGAEAPAYFQNASPRRSGV